eukprot:MONOS_3182.1-p1 / transcript=MONOS_3182.1 / gene=MONOS_3182 / organism=Monocercomonoides_exilis_PA203 / gene_product= Adaptor protein complex 3 (AP-3), sigma subunit / transcript_product= Adaptor protein complex 3 (AP-3), sigma subunit / location=Mono_scaffold00072:145209-145888(-) / protein_length=154 / sequence_SO=supercontig / SO=protein_coding / is_pseudo=false
MILSVIVVNNRGIPRLTRFYEDMTFERKKHLTKEIYNLISKRPASACNFLENTGIWGDSKSIKIIYRLYATLCFVIVCDAAENELAILDLIQNYVECLDNAFHNVCELHLIFNHEKCYAILDEIICAGLILETKSSDVLPSVDAMDKLDKASR